jgi:tight adherence protein B
VAGLLIALLSALTFGALGWVFFAGDDKAAKRAKEIAGPRRVVGKGRDAMEVATQKRKQSNAEALKDLGDRQKNARKSMVSIAGQIAQAGLTISPAHFWMGSAALGALAVGAGLMLGWPLWLTGLVGFASLVGLPRWILGFLRDQRQKKFSQQMADAVDVIVRGVKSGLPLNQCLKIIATETPEPLRGEFARVVDGQTMGVPLDQNLQKLFERMPLAEVNFFNIVLIIQQKAGGNLSEALGNLSLVLRSRRLLKEKIKALSSEAKASAGIIGSLPIIVMGLVYLTRPPYILILFTTDPGRIILFFSALSMFGGIMVMRNMINFKF